MEKQYRVEQVGGLWLLEGGEIEGFEIFAQLSDIPSRFFESLEIVVEGGAK